MFLETASRSVLLCFSFSEPGVVAGVAVAIVGWFALVEVSGDDVEGQGTRCCGQVDYFAIVCARVLDFMLGFLDE